MNQATLELRHPAAAAIDRVGFDIGWDHARHGLAPVAMLGTGDSPAFQGWMAGRAFYGRRRSATTLAVRQWLQLRLQAWHDGVAFDVATLDAAAVARLQVAVCPLLRRPLGGLAGDPGAAVFDRIDPACGYGAGNVAMISREAAALRAGVGVAAAMRRARRAEVCGEPVDGHDAGVWWRIAALASFGAAPAGADAARLPLALLPPPGVRPTRALQALQVALTRAFAMPGWSDRTRRIAATLPGDDLRREFHLVVGAIAPRVIEAGADALRRPGAIERVLENAWLNERVQRRWQVFAAQLGEAGAATLPTGAALPEQPQPRRLAVAAATAVAG